jgi:hypothetical protein
MLYVGQRPLDLIRKTRQSLRQRWLLTPVRCSFISGRGFGLKVEEYVLNARVDVAMRKCQCLGGGTFEDIFYCQKFEKEGSGRVYLNSLYRSYLKEARYTILSTRRRYLHTELIILSTR